MNKDLSLTERLNAPTPRIFRIIRNAGLIVGAAAGTIISLPALGLAVPVALLSGATVAAGISGSLVAAVSQLTVDWKAYADQQGYRMEFFPKRKKAVRNAEN